MSMNFARVEVIILVLDSCVLQVYLFVEKFQEIEYNKNFEFRHYVPMYRCTDVKIPMLQIFNIKFPF